MTQTTEFKITVNPCAVEAFTISPGPDDEDYEIHETDAKRKSLGKISVSQGLCNYPVTFVAPSDLAFLSME